MRKCVSSGTLISLQAAQDFRREGVMGKRSFEVIWKARMVFHFIKSRQHIAVKAMVRGEARCTVGTNFFLACHRPS